MNVSVVFTVKNEAASIHRLLESLAVQSRPPKEIVASDGGSTDGTLELLETYRHRLPLKIITAPGTNISQGRNRAIAAAAGPLIAVTDGGVTLDPDWLQEITTALQTGQAAVAGGWFTPDPHTDFEMAMGATVLPSLADINPATFLPSSRSVAFLKTAWQAAGGYPEWLDYCEDLVFDLALREQAGPFAFAPRAVAHFRPRGNLPAFARQYYLYARGDGKAGLFTRRHAIRYATYLVALPGLLGLIARGKVAGWLLLALGAAAYTARPAQRLWSATQGQPAGRRLRLFGLIPLIRLVGDVAKMIGYPVGLYWRWQKRRRLTP
jgi:glycosyltransferase involved in cell wall biosynthesis